MRIRDKCCQRKQGASYSPGVNVPGNVQWRGGGGGKQWKGTSLLKLKSLASDIGLAPRRFSIFAEGMYEESLF